MKFLLIIYFICLTLLSCRKVQDAEDPYSLARAYCHCVNDRAKAAPHESVNVNECNAIYYTSRFMLIHLSDGKMTLPKSTVDSAARFFEKVGNLQDSLCVSKIDSTKLKRRSNL